MGCVNEFMQLAGTRVGTAGAAGAVNVLYGSATGLSGFRHQDSADRYRQARWLAGRR